MTELFSQTSYREVAMLFFILMIQCNVNIYGRRQKIMESFYSGRIQSRYPWTKNVHWSWPIEHVLSARTKSWTMDQIIRSCPLTNLIKRPLTGCFLLNGFSMVKIHDKILFLSPLKSSLIALFEIFKIKRL